MKRLDCLLKNSQYSVNSENVCSYGGSADSQSIHKREESTAGPCSPQLLLQEIINNQWVNFLTIFPIHCQPTDRNSDMLIQCRELG